MLVRGAINPTYVAECDTTLKRFADEIAVAQDDARQCYNDRPCIHLTGLSRDLKKWRYLKIMAYIDRLVRLIRPRKVQTRTLLS